MFDDLMTGVPDAPGFCRVGVVVTRHPVDPIVPTPKMAVPKKIASTRFVFALAVDFRFLFA